MEFLALTTNLAHLSINFDDVHNNFQDIEEASLSLLPRHLKTLTLDFLSAKPDNILDILILHGQTELIRLRLFGRGLDELVSVCCHMNWVLPCYQLGRYCSPPSQAVQLPQDIHTEAWLGPEEVT
jgi:hypothetical protein